MNFIFGFLFLIETTLLIYFIYNKKMLWSFATLKNRQLERETTLKKIYSSIVTMEISNNNAVINYMEEHNFQNAYIYGAGEVGRIICQLLIKYGYTVDKFIDKKVEGNIDGIEVIRPGEALQKADVVIIALVKDCYKVALELEKCSVTNYVCLCDILDY